MFNYRLAKYLRLSFFTLGCLSFLAAVIMFCIGIFGDYGDYEMDERMLNFYISLGSFIGALWLMLGALATQFFAAKLGIDREEIERDEY